MAGSDTFTGFFFGFDAESQDKVTNMSIEKRTKNIAALFERHFKEKPRNISELQSHGSNRERYRLRNKHRSVIGVQNPDRAENVAFIEFCGHFLALGLPVPEVYVDDLDANIYIEEDLGDTTLFQALSQEREKGERFPRRIEDLYATVVTILPRFQIEASGSLNYDVCYPRHSFDSQSIHWDLNYFKYYFLKLAGISFDEQKLEDDFQKFSDFLLETRHDYFLYRDFQSRNIMVKNGQPFFIDFQGGRRGALQYDIASLLFDAKADLPFEARERLLTHYFEALAQYEKVDINDFIKYYYGYVLVRIMQAMGAYGFRGFYERKTHFLQSVPFAIRNLEFVLHTTELPLDIPTLTDCWQQLVRSATLRELGSAQLPLTVHIQSFSFKKGAIADETGHGGGFVFDCRSLPNPGRREQFKRRTGNDTDVIKFLEREEQVQSFLTRVRDLVSEVVENYQRKNFTQLSVAFGCTGGQHRSVYCANQLAKYLAKKEGVKVELSHGEETNWPQ